MKMKKILALALAAVLLMAVTVAGTLAWLKDTSETVTNTFTTSTIDVTLAESKDLNLQMIPGGTITKDPKATVTTPDADAWLFVEITKDGDFDKFMTYALADGWSILSGKVDEAGACVIYREVKQDAAAQEFAILKDNAVKVKSEVTKEDMVGAAPKLAFTAYVIQKDNMTGDMETIYGLAKAQ